MRMPVRTAVPIFCLGLAAFTGLFAAPALAARAKQNQLEAAPAKPASRQAGAMAAWVTASRDNHNQPFVIVDKKDAQVLVFYPDGRLRGAAPALLGLSHGDETVPGIGQRKLSTITPEERTTPAGRFVASLGNDLGQKNVLWVDYNAAISLHRVVTSNAKEHRLQRLMTPSISDNRISFGCINVPAKFFDTVVEPSFTDTNGIVYILPDAKSIKSVFPESGVDD